MQAGLRPTSKDSKRFKTSKLGTLFGPAKLEDVPLVDFLVSDPPILNQGNTLRCSGYATAAILTGQEGVDISPDYIYLIAKQIEGDMSDGASLPSVCKAVTKIGAIEASEWQEGDIPDSEIKQWWKYNQKYAPLALKHRQKSYFEVDGPYDFFDNVRSHLWHYRDFKRGVLVGTTYFDRWSFLKRILRAVGINIGGHAMAVIGQEVNKGIPYLVVQNSGGGGIGDNGRHYVGREVFNEYFKPYSAFWLLDMSPEEAKKLMDTQTSLYQKLAQALLGLLDLLKKKAL